MGVSRVDFEGDTLIDLTEDTVNEQSLLSGYTAHNKAGELIEGLAVIPTKLSQLENDEGYAKTESPAFTGIPTAPTPPDNTNDTQIATTAYVKKLISNLINGAPETLDTLKEIADALGENDDAVQALNAAIGNKVDKVAGKGLSTNDFTAADKKKLDGIADGADKTTYTNNLDETVEGTALDATQGRVLNEKIAELNGNIEWKYLGTESGKTQINLPEGWKEVMFLVRNGSNHFTHTLIKDMISLEPDIYVRDGFYYENIGAMFVTRVNSSFVAIYTAAITTNGIMSDVSASTRLYVWYR